MAKNKRTFSVLVFDGLTLFWRSHFNVKRRWSFTLAEKVLGLWWSSVGSTISYIGARAHTQAGDERTSISFDQLSLSISLVVLCLCLSFSFSRFQQKQQKLSSCWLSISTQFSRKRIDSRLLFSLFQNKTLCTLAHLLCIIISSDLIFFTVTVFFFWVFSFNRLFFCWKLFWAFHLLFSYSLT